MDSEREKNVYNVDTDEIETMEFLRLNQINKYNMEMGGVDIADQLRGVYRLDRWVRNRKWWWSLLFWSTGVLLTNAYKLYLRLCEEDDVVPRYKEQYQFRKAIAEYWINPDLVEKEARKAPEAPRGKKRDFGSISLKSVGSPLSPITGASPSSCAELNRSPQITDSSLDECGSLRIRLDTSQDHLCERASKKTRCGLHWWAANIRKESPIVRCPTCDVHLCVDCYGMFHRTPKLVRLKTKLAIDLKKELSNSRSGGNSRGTSRQL